MWAATEQPPTPFLDEHTDENVVAVATELRNRMATVEQQVLSQYTATAAYVTLAQQNSEAVRAEARADVERVQTTLIGLVEQVRADVKNRLECANIRPELPIAPIGADASPRLAALEERLHTMMSALESCVRDNVLLRQQVDELMRERNRAEGWLFATGSTTELSMH